MILFASVILGLFVGLIRRGNIFRLNSLRWLLLAILPLLSVFLMKYYPTIPLLPKAAVTTFTYLCVMIFLIVNRKYAIPAVFLGLGTLCNYLVIAANSFRMPISPTALSIYATMTPEAVISRRADYFVATNGANLMFLGDVIYFPKKIIDGYISLGNLHLKVYIPITIFEGFLSVGDILLAAGMFLLIVQVMGKNCVGRKKSTVDVK